MSRVLPEGTQRLVLATLAVVALMFAMVAPAFGQTMPEATPAAGPPTPAVTLGDNQAAISVVHASAAIPAVDILIDDQVALPNVSFGTVSEFLTVDSGDHNVKVVPAGGDVSQAVVDSDVTFDSGKVYAVVAAGTADKPEVKAFDIDNDPTANDSVRLKAIHAASSVDAIDIAPVQGDPIINDLSYFNASDSVDYTGQTVDLQVRAKGEIGSLATLPSFPATPGSSIAIIVTTDAQSNLMPLYVGVFPGTESDSQDVATPTN